MSEERVVIHSVERRDASEVVIAAEVHSSFYKMCRVRAVSDLSSRVELPGFRKGHIPEPVLIGAIGTMKILEEAAEIALRAVIPSILSSQKLRLLGQPEVTITKIAEGNPLGFKMKLSVLPEFTLPDYRILAKDIALKKEYSEVATVEDSEVEAVAKEVAALQSDHSQHNHSHSAETPVIESPVLTDDIARSIGNFRDLAHFKEVVRESLTEEKRRRTQDRRRLAILERISSSTVFDAPRILVEHELERMLARLTHDLERSGTTVETYLSDSKKTLDGIKHEWGKDAERQARYELIIARIAEEEKLAPSGHEIENLTARFLADAKQSKNAADRSRAHAYAERLLTNEMVFRFLEGDGTRLPEHSPDEKKRPS